MAPVKKTDTMSEVTGQTAAPLTDAQLDAEASRVGDELRAGKKVRIRISKSEINPNDEVVPVCVNGHLYQINRGETVEVPEVVAEILANAKYI